MLQDPFPCLFLLVNSILGILNKIFNIDAKCSIFLCILVLLGYNLRNPSPPWGHKNVSINFLQLSLQVIFYFQVHNLFRISEKGTHLIFLHILRSLTQCFLLNCLSFPADWWNSITYLIFLVTWNVIQGPMSVFFSFCSLTFLYILSPVL